MITIELQGTGLRDFTNALKDRSQIVSQLAGMNISIKSDAEYSGYVDQGTSKMSAQPFFISVFESHTLDEVGPDLTMAKVRQWPETVADDMRSQAPIDTGNLQSNIHVEG